MYSTTDRAEGLIYRENEVNYYYICCPTIQYSLVFQIDIFTMRMIKN